MQAIKISFGLRKLKNSTDVKKVPAVKSGATVWQKMINVMPKK